MNIRNLLLGAFCALTVTAQPLAIPRIIKDNPKTAIATGATFALFTEEFSRLKSDFNKQTPEAQRTHTTWQAFLAKNMNPLSLQAWKNRPLLLASAGVLIGMFCYLPLKLIHRLFFFKPRSASLVYFETGDRRGRSQILSMHGTDADGVRHDFRREWHGGPAQQHGGYADDDNDDIIGTSAQQRRAANPLGQHRLVAAGTNGISGLAVAAASSAPTGPLELDVD